ncbi:hypothetical protein, partial [Serratia marcescens]|uniref:hypothetical protein n=1 Tax=Serratia marcescens TaxID=615 RepID=UPI001953351C
SCRVTLERPQKGEAATVKPGIPLLSRRGQDEMRTAFSWFSTEVAGAVIDIHNLEPTDEAFISRTGFAAFLSNIVEKRTIQF